ncbi:MAG: CoA transferase, partial [Candidatus Binatia bacterium]
MNSPLSLPPLSGIRVLEWAEGIPGPTVGWLLAEAGAEVLKLERPQGDRLRGELGFHVLNRGKRGLVVDLEDARAREKLRRLGAAADVVVVDEIESRLEHFGLGYDAKRWPSLVWCSVPMFPRDGAFAGTPPVDALAEAVSGISAMQWSYSGKPVYFVTPMASYAAGFLTAFGAVAALRAREVIGRGQRVDSSALAAAMLLQTGTYVRGPAHQGSLAAQANDPRGVFPTYGLYQTADGWLFVGALTEAFWISLATLVGRTDWLADPVLSSKSPLAFGDPEIRERLRPALEPIFRSATTAEWLRRFDDNDIPGGRVQSRREFLDEPTAAAI